MLMLQNAMLCGAGLYLVMRVAVQLDAGLWVMVAGLVATIAQFAHIGYVACKDDEE